MPNQYLQISLVALFIFFSQTNYSQCETCDPDVTCISEFEQPSVCPEIMPDATSGEYYEEVLTFYLPSTFEDVESGQTVTLNQVVITNVTGLPFGMDYTLNNEDLNYYPNEGENHGCATICGIPILAGEYNVVITTHVFVTVLGFNLEVDQSFVNTLIVQQGEGGNSTFSYDIITGCGNVETNFEALIDSDSQPIDWAWNFGNGNSSTDQVPETQQYNEAGNFTVSLTTQLWNYQLEEVNLIDVGGDWAGDIEEPIESLANPDPYFVILDELGNIVYTSEVADNTNSNTWSNLGIILNNPPYSIEFFDDDNISEHDFLASFSVDLEEGYQTFDDGETEGLILVDLVVSDTFYDEQEIVVFSYPEYTFVVDEDNNTITIEGDTTITGFQWYINGEAQTEVTNQIEMDAGGVYYCSVSNSFGCVLISEEYIHCPEFVPAYNDIDNALFAPDNFDSYQWYFNGLPIDGETSSTYLAPNSGNYAVEITTSYGCSIQSEWLEYIDNVNIEYLTSKGLLSVYPNPTSDYITIKSENNIKSVSIINEIGQQVYTISVNQKQNVQVNMSDFETGIYFVKIETETGSYLERIIKK